ncbi:unnamed protein product [Peniophora sp. CBMAI 1063]|nr:unnamed protein product [Peniophora sp. CBMAI 1063]
MYNKIAHVVDCFNVLPNELLVQILLRAGDIEPSTVEQEYLFDKWPLTLREVCRRWRDILDSCPKFWATLLGVAADDEAWTAMFERAGNAPIFINTMNRVSLAAQAAEIARAGRVHVSRDDGTTSWNDVLSRAGSLPNLSALRLDRALAVRSNSTPLQLRAPNLLSLALDCEGVIVAPALDSIEFLSISPTFPSFFRSVIESCGVLRDVSITARACGNFRLWQEVFVALDSTRITSLTVALAAVNAFSSPPAISMASLLRLKTNVPTPIISPSLSELFVDCDLSEMASMLCALPSIRKLVIGKYAYCRTGRFSFRDNRIPVVILPYCDNIVYQPPATQYLTELLSILHVPRLSRLHLNVDLSVLWGGHRVEFYGREDFPENPVSTTRPTWSNRLTESMEILSPHLEDLFFNAVTLRIHAAQSRSGRTVVEFSARASSSTSEQDCAVVMEVSADLLTSSGSRQDYKSPFSPILSAFCWSSVTTIELSYPDAVSGPDYWREDPDLMFGAIENTGRLAQDLLRRTKSLETLVICVVDIMEEEGIPLLRYMVADGQANILVHLREIRLVVRSPVGERDCGDSRWWTDVRAFITERRITCGCAECLPLRIVFDGAVFYPDTLGLRVQELAGLGCVVQCF